MVAVDCEVDSCGVLASGRCAACGLAFCSSHAHDSKTCERCWLEALRAWLDALPPCAVCSEPAWLRCASCSRRFCTAHPPVEIVNSVPDGLWSRETARFPRCEFCSAAIGSVERSRRAAVDDLVAELNRIDDPVERLVVASQHGEAGRSNTAMPPSAFKAVILGLWPKWSGDTMFGYPWKGSEIAAWFARTAGQAGIRPDGPAEWVTYPKSGLRGRPKRRVEMKAAWSFPQTVFVDGTFSPSIENQYPFSSSSGVFREREVARLTIYPETMRQMARRLGLAGPASPGDP